MSEFNFDKLKNHEIPDSWVSGALNVPPKDKKPPIVFAKFTKTLAFAATFVVVCALSVTLFIFTQKGDTLLPHTPTQGTIETTLPTQTETQSTESNSKITPTNPTEPKTDSPTESSEDLEEETIKETSKPTQNPSDSTTPNSKPSSPNSPTVTPDSPEKDPEDNPPTTNPDEDKEQNSDAVSTPNGGASSKPSGGTSEGDTSLSNKIVFSDTISLDTYLSDPDIYFNISSRVPENMNGNFPDMKKADIIFANGMVHIECTIDIVEENLKPGEYQYVFYNSSNVISIGTFKVN